MWSHGNTISWRGKVFSTFIDDFLKKNVLLYHEESIWCVDNLNVIKTLVKNQTRNKLNVITLEGNGVTNRNN
jgi:hypothetical protein